MTKLADLQSAIDRAAQCYYDLGPESSGLTDTEYDTLINALRRIDAEDPRLTRVGPPWSASDLRNKTKHGIPMGSLDNTEGGIDGFAKWFNWLADQCDGGIPTGGVPAIHVSLKMDGSSVAAYYEDGRLQRVVSRGNGEVGEDLTANAVKWRHLPTSIPGGFTGAVRGEAMLFHADFDKVNQENRTPPDEISNHRGVGNGILGRSDGKQSGYIRFIAFNAVGTGKGWDDTSLAAKLETLKKYGFHPVQYRVIGRMGRTASEVILDVIEYFAEINAQRDGLHFGIDGVVACVNDVGIHKMLTRDKKDALRPRYARAVKFDTMKNETTVNGVTITVGHTGAIYPTADLEPVRVGGVTVKSALLNNWNPDSDAPTAAHIKIGDLVEVELAGDIIPKIVRVTGSSSDSQPIDEPDKCPACGSPTTREHRGKIGAVTYCSNPAECSAAAIYRIKHYIGSSKKGIGILGIGDAVLEALISSGLVSAPADLYKLKDQDIADLQIGTNRTGRPIHLGLSRATTICSNISKAKVVPLAKFLGALGVDLLGRRRAEILIEDCNLRTIGDWLDENMLAKIPGDTTRESIINGLRKIRPTIDALLEVVDVRLGETPVEAPLNVEPTTVTEKPVLGPAAASPGDKQFAGYSFCFTGTRTHLDAVKARGGEIKSGISKALTILVQKDAASVSNKTKKAESYGVKIISVECLGRLLDGSTTMQDLGL